jgi:SNF2 family DNA or RNA helicase
LEYYSPASERGELYLTTYQTLFNDQENLVRFLDQKDNRVFLVIDEAHYIKQIGGSWAEAILRVSDHAKYRCVLTGTPIPRSYTDVFNLFDFLWPHDSPLDSDAKIRIKMQEGASDISPVRDILKLSIGPLFYRVRKSDLGLVPANFHAPYVISMNKYENEIYRAVERKIIDYSRQDYLRNIELVKRLGRGRIVRLRQCASYAKLLLSGLEGYRESVLDDRSHLADLIYEYDRLEVPAKIQHLIKVVDVIQREKQKVVIWAHFVGTLKLIVRHLRESGFNCKLIFGGTPIEQTSVDEEETREQIRNEFVQPASGLDILVANPAACGESISLHKTCFHAIYYDLSYNCAQYLQSLDRIHRVGGSEINQAHYHFLQYDGTIEEDIRHNLEHKARRMQELIDEDYGIYSLDMFDGDDDAQAYERLFGDK